MKELLCTNLTATLIVIRKKEILARDVTIRKNKTKNIINDQELFCTNTYKKTTGGNTDNHEKHVADNSVSAVLL